MAYPQTEFQKWLEQLCACDEGRIWVGRKSLSTFWRTCPNPRWMAWLLIRLGLITDHWCSCGCWAGDQIPPATPKSIRKQFPYFIVLKAYIAKRRALGLSKHCIKPLAKVKR